MKTVFWLVMTIGAIIYFIVVIGWLNEGNAERQEADLCQKYTSLPETQVDRIPDGCVPYYYQNR